MGLASAVPTQFLVCCQSLGFPSNLIVVPCPAMQLPCHKLGSHACITRLHTAHARQQQHEQQQPGPQNARPHLDFSNSSLVFSTRSTGELLRMYLVLQVGTRVQHSG